MCSKREMFPFPLPRENYAPSPPTFLVPKPLWVCRLQCGYSFSMSAVGAGGDGNGDQVGEGGTKEDNTGKDNRNR